MPTIASIMPCAVVISKKALRGGGGLIYDPVLLGG
jgi:hypothetical protein